MTTVDIRSGSSELPAALAADDGADLMQTGPVASEGSTGRAGALLQRVTRPVIALRAVPHVATYAGLLVTLIGGILLLVAWGKTAGLTNVALQIPFLVSAGCTGLAFVAVGLTVINLAAKHEDATRRRAQVTELHGLLAELRTALTDAPTDTADERDAR